MTVSGVLDSDYYSLYPYETNASLKVGFSKYGELINSAANVGLEYGAVDPPFFFNPFKTPLRPSKPTNLLFLYKLKRFIKKEVKYVEQQFPS